MEEISIYLIVGWLVLLFVVCLILIPPFRYPYFDKKFDVSGKRNPDLEKLIENFINEGGFTEIQDHNERIQIWKEECETRIQNSVLQNWRRNQYNRCLDDDNTYRFYMFRMQTRYRQRNYQKFSYRIEKIVEGKQCSYEWMRKKYQQLEAIGFETTLQDYHSKEQRKLMTKQLREKISQRDNYTCQICGKYMPDGVGLQIDHIVPVAKKGKTVPSNLQVLCSKCNGRKSDKV